MQLDVVIFLSSTHHTIQRLAVVLSLGLAALTALGPAGPLAAFVLPGLLRFLKLHWRPEWFAVMKRIVLCHAVGTGCILQDQLVSHLGCVQLGVALQCQDNTVSVEAFVCINADERKGEGEVPIYTCLHFCSVGIRACRFMPATSAPGIAHCQRQCPKCPGQLGTPAVFEEGLPGGPRVT